MFARKMRIAAIAVIAVLALTGAMRLRARATAAGAANAGDAARTAASDPPQGSPLPVIYFPRQKVDASFAKATPVHQSPVLYDGENGLRSYKIAPAGATSPATSRCT